LGFAGRLGPVRRHHLELQAGRQVADPERQVQPFGSGVVHLGGNPQLLLTRVEMPERAPSRPSPDDDPATGAGLPASVGNM